jgi:hypothetical protein
VVAPYKYFFSSAFSVCTKIWWSLYCTLFYAVSAFTGTFEESSSEGLSLVVLQNPHFINTEILVNQGTWREIWLYKQTKNSEQKEKK